MSRELQDRGFEQSAYERPSLEWVCGWAAEGRPCPLGPDHAGNCVVTHQCTPALRGDRWICARPKAAGGSCPDGPFPDGTCCNAIPPCQPKPSMRRKRGRLSRWAAVATVALAALPITGDSGRNFISPGDVSLAHGSVGECTNCHASAAGGAADWFTAAFHGGSGVGDSERCLTCHETNLGKFSGLPHSVPSDALIAVRERVVSQASSGSQSIALAAARVVDVSAGANGQLACASCHHEHRGREHDIRALSNDQCQVCHVKPFASLADGHPAFTNFPYERRTRIQFNHVAHKNDAFPKKRAFRCEECHEIDVDGQVMLVVGYESACGGCHAAEVDTSSGMYKRSGLFPGNSSDGVPFLALPGFDPEALEDAGIQVGQWPEDATFDLEDPLNPFMRMLLSADEGVAEALALLPADLAFTDASDLDEEGLEAAGKVIWGVKGLFYDLVSDGQPALQERLEAGIGRGLTAPEFALLTANLDIEAVAAAQREWFPNLAQEMRAYRAGNSAATELIGAESPDLETTVGWYRSGTFDLRYRPSGHQDPFLRNWLEVSTERNDAAPAGVLEGLFANMAASSAEGGCVKCHSVDAVEGDFAVNWLQKRRDLDSRGANRFLHSPHMTALSVRAQVEIVEPPPVEEVAAAEDAGEEDAAAAETPIETTVAVGGSCAQCHQLVEDGSSATDESFAGHDPHSFASSFEPIEKSTCAGCHASGEANDSCLNCHNYHIGERIPTTRLEREASVPRNPAHADRSGAHFQPAS
jgi:hypothetical protein